MIEDACREQIDLPATVLLRGRADELDRHAETLRFGRSEQEGADVGEGDEVVAAPVTDALERVIFREKRDARARRADAGAVLCSGFCWGFCSGVSKRYVAPCGCASIETLLT